jgi:hypothetical protein
MIVKQSLATVLAERFIGDQKPVISSPSPRGEGWGEGELNLRGLKSALTFILTPDSRILNSNRSNPVNSIQFYSSSFKAIQAPPPGYMKKAIKNNTARNINYYQETI